MKYTKAFIAATMITVSYSQMQAIELKNVINTFIELNKKEPELLRIHRYIDIFVSNNKTAGIVNMLKYKYKSLQSIFKEKQENLCEPPLNETGMKLMTKYLAILNLAAKKLKQDYDQVEQDGNEIFVNLINNKSKKANL